MSISVTLFVFLGIIAVSGFVLRMAHLYAILPASERILLMDLLSIAPGSKSVISYVVLLIAPLAILLEPKVFMWPVLILVWFQVPKIIRWIGNYKGNAKSYSNYSQPFQSIARASLFGLCLLVLLVGLTSVGVVAAFMINITHSS